jgi:hypothetical protein
VCGVAATVGAVSSCRRRQPAAVTLDEQGAQKSSATEAVHRHRQRSADEKSSRIGELYPSYFGRVQVSLQTRKWRASPTPVANDRAGTQGRLASGWLALAAGHPRRPAVRRMIPNGYRQPQRPGAEVGI